MAFLVGCGGRGDQHAHVFTGKCIYARAGISGLAAAERTLKVKAECTVVFDGEATWQDRDQPWFVTTTLANYQWAKWVTQQAGRQLIVTVDLIPSALTSDGSWRSSGAAGAYNIYARAFAHALVAGGLGNAYVRLGNEANGQWEDDWIGGTQRDWGLWREFWRDTALAMQSAPGAHFRFVWCVAAGIGHVPYNAYYPGNDVVSVIAFDVYDTGFALTSGDRWTYLVQRPNGIATLLRFAQGHHKPAAIPEWGLWPSPSGGGDDPGFIRGVAGMGDRPGLAFQSYWYAGKSADALMNSPQSLAAYRSAFGAN